MNPHHDSFRRGTLALPREYEDFDTAALMFRVFNSRKIGACSVILRGTDAHYLADDTVATHKVPLLWFNADGSLAWDEQDSHMLVPACDPDLHPPLREHCSSDYTFLLPENAPTRIFQKRVAATPTPAKNEPKPKKATGAAQPRRPDFGAAGEDAEPEQAEPAPEKKKKKRKSAQAICEACWQPYYIFQGKRTHGSRQLDSICTITCLQ